MSAVDINRIHDYYSSEKHSDGLPEKQRSSKLAAHNQLTYKHNYRDKLTNEHRQYNTPLRLTVRRRSFVEPSTGAVSSAILAFFKMSSRVVAFWKCDF